MDLRRASAVVAFCLRSIVAAVIGTAAILARPIPALRFLAALGVVAAIAQMPANALISPTAAVGAIPGTFAVSPTGAATYAIPIVVAPGANGMQPNLALVYDSQGGNGLLGIGWRLSGLSVIRRCGATIEIDGFKGGVNYDANDKFCLDGERLVSIGGNQYRTFRESLLKITYVGAATNPDSFTVTDTNGTTREYAVPIEAAGNPNVRRLWALSKIKDTSGNYLTIAYDKSDVAASGDYRPSSIEYTANDGAGVGATNSIVFKYTTRSDVVPVYEGGSAIKTLRRLSEIGTYTGGDMTVADYLLGYDNGGASGRSRLTSVQICGTGGGCLPPTTFSWSDDNGYFGDLNLGTYGNAPQNPRIFVSDYNGDGKSDVLYVLQNGDSSFDWRLRPEGTSVGLADLLTSTTNGLGSATYVAYRPLSDASVYSKDTGAQASAYPYQEIQDATYVVASVSQSNGIGGTNATTYLYGGLKKHLTAGISLGFRWIQVTDPAGLIHITHYNQNREAGIDGTVAVAQLYSPGGGVLLKSTTNTWTSAANVCGGTSQAQLTASVEVTRELNNAVVTQVNTNNTYDSCGFPASVVTDSNDGWRKTVTNTYQNDTTNWILGRVTQSQVTAEAPNQVGQTRTSSFSYRTDGLLASEVVEPNTPALTLTTTFGYDAFGNRTSKTVSGPDIATRSESQAYDPTGRFIISRTNALGRLRTSTTIRATVRP